MPAGKTAKHAEYAKAFFAASSRIDSENEEGQTVEEMPETQSRDELDITLRRASAVGELVKSKQRIADHGEVFTPAWLVEAMQRSNWHLNQA